MNTAELLNWIELNTTKLIGAQEITGDKGGELAEQPQIRAGPVCRARPGLACYAPHQLLLPALLDDQLRHTCVGNIKPGQLPHVAEACGKQYGPMRKQLVTLERQGLQARKATQGGQQHAQTAVVDSTLR